jgi:hypothetical protein
MSKTLWILLLCFLTCKLWAQSTTATTKKTSDSLAVATDYIGNAKQIHRDLIRGDGAIKREVVYLAQISDHEKENKRLAGELATCQKTSQQLTLGLASSQLQVEKEQLKTNQAKLQIWLLRGAIVLYLAGKVKGLLP